jgi:membrane protein involved in colicin uptake
LQRSQQPLVSRWGQMMFNRELKHRLEFLKQQREAEEARKKKELEQKAAKEAEEKLKQKEAHAKTKK